MQANSYFTVHCAIFIAKCGMHISVLSTQVRISTLVSHSPHFQSTIPICLEMFSSPICLKEKTFPIDYLTKSTQCLQSLCQTDLFPPSSIPSYPQSTGQPIHKYEGGLLGKERGQIFLAQQVSFQHLDGDHSVTLAHSWSCPCLQCMHFCICQLPVGLPWGLN